MKLSKRLQTVAKYLPEGRTVADIGSDHAYLPVFLVENNITQLVVAGEVNLGPYQSAKRTVEEHGLSNQIIVRKGNGLSVLQPGEVEVVTINGMGGGTIVQILQHGEEQLRSVRRLVLQPMVDSEQLRTWLHENQWQIICEDIVIDDGLLYEIVVAERGEERYGNPLWYEVGNVKILQNHPLFPDKLRGVLAEIDRVLMSLCKSRSEATEAKRIQLLQKKNRLEEVLRIANSGS